MPVALTAAGGAVLVLVALLDPVLRRATTAPKASRRKAGIYTYSMSAV